MRAADEVVEFLANQIPLDRLLGFRTTETTRLRVWELVEKEKQQGLTPDEKSELDDYERLEHLLILARAKARTPGTHG
jgi:hypothetical protein